MEMDSFNCITPSGFLNLSFKIGTFQVAEYSDIRGGGEGRREVNRLVMPPNERGQ